MRPLPPGCVCGRHGTDPNCDAHASVCICVEDGVVDPHCPAIIVPAWARWWERHRIKRKHRPDRTEHRPRRRWLRRTDMCRCGEFMNGLQCPRLKCRCGETMNGPECPVLKLALTIELIAAHA